MILGGHIFETRLFGCAPRCDVRFAHMSVNYVILAGEAGRAIGMTADLTALTFTVQKNLKRWMRTKRWLVDNIDEHRTRSFACGLNGPRLTSLPASALGSSSAADQMYLPCIDRTEWGMSDHGRRLGRRARAPPSWL